LSKLVRLLDTASKFVLFSVSGLKDEKFIKSKPTWKQKHANSILQPFEYFCQMSSESIPIMSSYTVSKLVRFVGTAYITSCVIHIDLLKGLQCSVVCFNVKNRHKFK